MECHTLVQHAETPRPPSLPDFSNFSLDGKKNTARTPLPDTPRRPVDPSRTASLETPQSRLRTLSPSSQGHARSHSATALSAPPMARTRSLPTVSMSKPFHRSPSHSPVRPSSPLRPSSAHRSSPRRSLDESHPQTLQPPVPSFMEIESIAEDSELDIPPRNGLARDTQTSPLPTLHSSSMLRSNSGRRRPVSPLHQQTQPPSDPPHTSSPDLQSSSRFNEPFPTHSSSGSFSLSVNSSIPSTPTSLRSRSPSISSLDTIEDSPDAEEAASEAHHLARLKAAADAAEAAEADAKTARKLKAAGLEVPGSKSGSVLWSPQGLKEKRKRWSVCGAERRGDFEMETIWED